ncbi:MAG: hypothetical protein AAB612_03850 [Patescibacteria group bacterium]
MNIWKIPPVIKVYEALGAIADGRVHLYNDYAEVFSSDKHKKYTVIFNLPKKIIAANDNGSFWQKYLGYPAIAVLILKNIIPYDAHVAESLKDIPWKEWNDEFHQDYAKTLERVHRELKKQGIETSRVIKAIENVMEYLHKTPYLMPEKLQRPPSS